MAVRKALRTLMAHRQVMLRPLRPLKVHQPHPLASALLGIPVAPVDQGHRPVISLFSLLTFIFVLLKNYIQNSTNLGFYAKFLLRCKRKLDTF